LQVSRRSDPAGAVVLAPIAQHRLSMHLSPCTVTACRDTGKHFTRLRGDIDITPAGEPGGFDAKAPSASLEVRIPAGMLEHVAHELEIASTAVPVQHMVRDARMQHLLLALEAERSGASPPGPFADGIASALATLLLANRPFASSAALAGASPASLQCVVDYVEANLQRPLTIEHLARVAGVGRSSLQQAFKARHGMAIHRYVMLRRVDRARTLVLQGRTPWSEAALLAGFSHQSHMARWMRRVLGATPTQLALAHRGKPEH
jgi:AraC family transcriptional regulator